MGQSNIFKRGVGAQGSDHLTSIGFFLFKFFLPAGRFRELTAVRSFASGIWLADTPFSSWLGLSCLCTGINRIRYPPNELRNHQQHRSGEEEEEEGRKCSLAYCLSCIIIVIIIISYIIRRRRGGREFTLGCLYFGRAVLAWREKSWQQQGGRRRGRKRIEVVV